MMECFLKNIPVFMYKIPEVLQKAIQEGENNTPGGSWR